MEFNLETLFQYGVLGMWCAYMIYRDHKNQTQIRDLVEFLTKHHESKE